MLSYLKLLRPQQWVKNLLVFSGIFFGHHLHDAEKMRVSILLFFSFCAVASAVYILNDYWDRHSDRAHPKKRHRPIANQTVHPRMAVLISSMLMGMGMVLAASTNSLIAFGTVFFYLLMNISYSYRLKHVVLLDVMILSSSYLLRIIAGTEGAGIPISSWLFLCALSATMLMGFGKRYIEKMLIENGHQRRSVQDYDEKALIAFLIICATSFIVFYGLFCLDAQSVSLHGRRLIVSFPFVLLGVFRFIQLVLQKNEWAEDPASLLWHDKPSFFLTAGWLISFSLIVGY